MIIISLLYDDHIIIIYYYITIYHYYPTMIMILLFTILYHYILPWRTGGFGNEVRPRLRLAIPRDEAQLESFRADLDASGSGHWIYGKLTAIILLLLVYYCIIFIVILIGLLYFIGMIIGIII